MNYAYNLNGSLTNAANDTFARAAYHKHSALPVSIVGSGGSASLCYDSMGRRITKNGAVKVSYRRGLDGGIVPLSENVGGDDVVYIETPSGHQLSRSSTIYYRHSLDHLGSVRMRINAAECVSAMYSAYGDCNVTTPLRYTFTGYELDAETNLMNAWRRLYAPKLGRFVMVDPSLEFSSPYLYCNGDPFNHTDPTGEISSAVINGIIAATIFIATVIITVATLGIAAPEVDPSDAVALTTLLGENLAEPEETTLATTTSGYALEFGLIGAGSSTVSNAAQLVTKSARGEHISAWQAVKAMLVQPAISFVTGAIGGAVTGIGTLAFRGMFVTTMSFAAGSAVTTSSSILLGDAINREKVDGADLGLQLGIAVAESMALVPFFAAVHPRATIETNGKTICYTNRINAMRRRQNARDNTMSILEKKRERQALRMKFLHFRRQFGRRQIIIRPEIEDGDVGFQATGEPQVNILTEQSPIAERVIRSSSTEMGGSAVLPSFEPQ